jgi:GNAT superfamily N-acetyltransferase
MAVEVRPRKPTDLVRCVELLAEVHAADGYPAIWPSDPGRWLTPSRLLGAWVAGPADALTGHVGLSGVVSVPSAELWVASTGLGLDRLGAVRQLFVSPSARRQGTGERLLAIACAEARRRGLHPVLDVIDRNRAAMALYEQLGWRIAGSLEVELAGRPELLVCYVAP